LANFGEGASGLIQSDLNFYAHFWICHLVGKQLIPDRLGQPLLHKFFIVRCFPRVLKTPLLPHAS
jgi:hypothetical protein